MEVATNVEGSNANDIIGPSSEDGDQKELSDVDKRGKNDTDKGEKSDIDDRAMNMRFNDLEDETDGDELFQQPEMVE